MYKNNNLSTQVQIQLNLLEKYNEDLIQECRNISTFTHTFATSIQRPVEATSLQQDGIDNGDPCTIDAARREATSKCRRDLSRLEYIKKILDNNVKLERNLIRILQQINNIH